MPMVEIRCCCDPGKLLGVVPVLGFSAPGADATFLLPMSFEALADDPVETVAMKWGVYCDPEGNCRPALKSKNIPMDVLRRIHGFQSATDGNSR